MANKDRYTKEQVAQALYENATNVGAAIALGCTDQTIMNYRERFPELNEAQQLGRQRVTEAAINNVSAAVLDGAEWATKWWLQFSPQGKREGFGKADQVEHTHRLDPATLGPVRPASWDEARDRHPQLKAMAPVEPVEVTENDGGQT